MERKSYMTPESRIMFVRFEAEFMGSTVISGYPGSDDPVIDEGELS